MTVTVAATCVATGDATRVAGMAAKTYSVNELAGLTGLSVSAIKKAIAEKRVRAHKRNGMWAIDPADPQVQAWLHRDESHAAAAHDDLIGEIDRLRRENANLATRVRQAEAAQRRAERKVRRMERELTDSYRASEERAQRDTERIYNLSHEVIERASQENTRTMLKIVSMLTSQTETRPVLRGSLADNLDI